MQQIQKYVIETYKYPVPTANELNLFFRLFNDTDPELIAYALIATQIMRPSEVANQEWQGFTFNKEKNDIVEHRHLAYKPTRRRTLNGRNDYYKELKKPMFSRWLSHCLIKYAKVYPPYERKKVFNWTTPDMLHKKFSNIRKKALNGKLGKEYDFLIDTNIRPLECVANKTKFRFNPYSLRRFAFTFHYWVTYKQDCIKLAKDAGHSDPITTFKHYIMPFQAIGLTQEMIDNKITIDEFIKTAGKKQLQIITFFDDYKQRMLPYGQSTINDFLGFEEKISPTI